MTEPTEAERLASYVVSTKLSDLSSEARAALKARVLDAIGCAIGALPAEPIGRLRRCLDELGGAPRATLIGGGRTATDRAALFNGALVRYLDFNDSYLARGETCHPSDNLGAVLAGAEHAAASGAVFMTALAVAYQVQCRLSDEAPVRHRGFDHTTQGAYAAAAGVARALGLDQAKTANAIAISGTAFNALRVTRTGKLSHWKGLAYPATAFCATNAVLLAAHGITGPAEVFEGVKGFKEAIAGPFSIDWHKEGLDRVTRTIIKRYNAEVHSQSTIEGVLELRASGELAPSVISQIESVELEIFDVAYHIIGGGAEGDKYKVSSKEQADHSLPYLVAVALLDGAVGPAQFAPPRIAAPDVQRMLRRVRITPNPELSRRFPDELGVRIRIQLGDGRYLECEKHDYEGFFTRPMSWNGVVEKFHGLAAVAASLKLRREIVAAVEGLEELSVGELTRLLGQVNGGG